MNFMSLYISVTKKERKKKKDAPASALGEFTRLYLQSLHIQSPEMSLLLLLALSVCSSILIPLLGNMLENVCHLGFKHHTVHNTSHPGVITPQQSISSPLVAGNRELLSFHPFKKNRRSLLGDTVRSLFEYH